MTDNELLLAISEIMDIKIHGAIEPVRKDLAEVKKDLAGVKKDLAGVKEDVSGLKAEMAEVKADLAAAKYERNSIKDEVHKIKVDLLENNVLPRMSNIESHYVLTADRYVASTETIQAMKADMDIMKKVIREHSEKLQKIS